MEYYDWNTVEYYGISTIDMKYMNTIEYSNNIYIYYIYNNYVLYTELYNIIYIYTAFPSQTGLSGCHTGSSSDINRSHDTLEGSNLLKDPRPDSWQGCTCHYHLPTGACRGSRFCVPTAHKFQSLPHVHCE